MPRDDLALKRALDGATPGNQDDIYAILATWNDTMSTALEEHGGDRFRDVFWDYLEATIECVDAAAIDGGDLDWAFLQDCADGYPAGVGDHHCTAVLANVLGRCVIRTRIRTGVDAIPAWPLEYLGAITHDDGDAAWEESGAFGWGIGHDDVAVADRILTRAEADAEYWASMVLTHALFADPHVAIDCYERILQSPKTREDLHYVEGMQRILDESFPRRPRYWDPTTELDAAGSLSEEQTNHLLQVLGENVHPDRLRHFDDMIQFDLSRAATEYGTDA